MKTFQYLCILTLLATLSACGGRQPEPGIVKNPDDPLIGKIYFRDGPSVISSQELYQRMLESDVIYLGENHDNVHHHKIQLDTIRKLVELGKQPVVGFEFFSRSDTPRLNQHQSSDDKYHNKDNNHAEKLLRQQLGWGPSRDDDWNHLYPILQYAREQNLPVFGADLSAAMRKQISKQGYAGLNAVEKLLAPESDFEDDNYRQYMLQSFTRAHCGFGDEKYLGKLYDAWLARNEAMAQSIVAMLEENPEQPVVVIMGGGHSEYNMAVVERVARHKPTARQLNLRLRAVADTPLEASEYFAALEINGQSYGAAFDYQWFTARMPEREDPCVAFLKFKEKHTNRKDAAKTGSNTSSSKANAGQ